MAIGGLFLRIGAMILRAIEFGAAAVALGIYSYFLAVLADHNQPISKWKRAVEGMSGAAVLYTICGFLFTLCLGGVAFFGYLAVILDICFMGCFIAIAWYTRHSANSCEGFVRTPLGRGESYNEATGYSNTALGVRLHTACRLNTAVFAVSIINVVFFFLTACYQVAIVQHHRKEKRFGPSPANNYTAGSGNKRGAFWKRNKNVNTRDAENATALPAPTQHAVRPSGETGYTNTTIGNNHYETEPKYGQPGYGQATNY